jgi:hypothetical protein
MTCRFLVCVLVVLIVAVLGPPGLVIPSTQAAQDKVGAPVETPRKSVRVHLFFDDTRRVASSDWKFSVACDGAPVDVVWIGPNEARIGAVDGKCTLRFSAEGQEAVFPDFGSDLLASGGELVVAFLTNPALLEQNVSLSGHSTVERDARSRYDDARTAVCEAWHRASEAQQKRTTRVAFYNFTPDTEGDPVEVTGYYFELQG